MNQLQHTETHQMSSKDKRSRSTLTLRGGRGWQNRSHEAWSSSNAARWGPECGGCASPAAAPRPKPVGTIPDGTWCYGSSGGSNQDERLRGGGSGKVPETPQTLGVTPLLGTTRFKLQVKGSLTVDTLRVSAEGAARRHSTRHAATRRRLHQGLPLLATHPGSSPGKGPNSPMVGQGPPLQRKGSPRRGARGCRQARLRRGV